MLARWGTRIRNYGLCVIYVARRQRNEEADKKEDTDDKEGTRGGGKRCTHKAAGSPGPRKPLEGSRPSGPPGDSPVGFTWVMGCAQEVQKACRSKLGGQGKNVANHSHVFGTPPRHPHTGML